MLQEDLHQLVTQLNTDYSTTSLYRKNDVMGDVMGVADNWSDYIMKNEKRK